MINLCKEYRTREGNRVRALTHQRQIRKVILNGEVRGTANIHMVIVGQVHMMDDLTDHIGWCNRVWDEDGKDLTGKATCDLLEYIEPKISQPQLF